MEAADCSMYSRFAEIGPSVQSAQPKETASPENVESSVSKGSILPTYKHNVTKGDEYRDLRTSIVSMNFSNQGLYKVGQYDKSAQLYQPNKPRMVKVIKGEKLRVAMIDFKQVLRLNSLIICWQIDSTFLIKLRRVGKVQILYLMPNSSMLLSIF